MVHFFNGVEDFDKLNLGYQVKMEEFKPFILNIDYLSTIL